MDVEIAVVLRVGAVFAMVNTVLFGTLGILIRNKWEWFRLKHFDREEYEFRLENPSIVTKMIRSAISSEDGQENIQDNQEITEQERTA